ncbi:MAG: hypothetical protein H0Z24_09490 [Thermosipho sp. (in: Bacteria)]|nr:hypothetical protein [Thermosipho sp. (in: thermotogales)]
MADTSKLNYVTKYVLEQLSNEFKTKLVRRKVRVGSKGALKSFAGVSSDSSIIVHVCHHSGRTKSGNIPVGKLNGLYARCYFMEKTAAREKYIYFTNKEFYEIFKKDCEGIIEGIALRPFISLPMEYQEILSEVLKKASDEM